MKKTLLLLAMVIYFIPLATAQGDAAKVQALLNSVLDFDDTKLSVEFPILSLQSIASQQADTTLILTRENMASALIFAKEYSKGIITVAHHTVVFIEDWDNCQRSGSWGACMPRGHGYIKKRDMVEMSNFINNIIGVPDVQRRTLFLFK